MTGTTPGLRLPEADARVLARREEIIAALRAIVPGEGVISHEREMRPYESDGLTAYRQLPLVVVLPSTTEQVAAVLKYCHDNEIRVVPRGSGTSLSGGKGTIVGTIIGALIISVINNGLQILSVRQEWQNVILGLVILIVVFIDQLRARRAATT